jgi:hypothetical protein
MTYRQPVAAENSALLTRLDGHLIVHPEHAEALLELLDLLGEVLRYGGDDLRADIAERFHPGTHAHLTEALDTHAGLLRRTTTTLHKGLKSR